MELRNPPIDPAHVRLFASVPDADAGQNRQLALSYERRTLQTREVLLDA
jgi:hypothetical protein